MKKTILVSMAAVALTAMASCGGKLNLNKSVELNNASDSLSYALGLMADQGLGAAVKSGHPELVDFTPDQFMKGVEAAFKTDTTQKYYDMGVMCGIQIKNMIASLSKEYGVELDANTAAIALKQAIESDSTILIPANQGNYIAQMIIREIENKRAEENKAKGEAFLAEKAQEEGVVKTESGLLYKVVKAGEGETLKADQQATVSYKGTLMDGTEFDANESATFSPNGVVPGFGEGLQLMQKGGEYILYIPSDLGYGSRAVGGKIPASSVLVFEVKVLDIK